MHYQIGCTVQVEHILAINMQVKTNLQRIGKIFALISFTRRCGRNDRSYHWKNRGKGKGNCIDKTRKSGREWKNATIPECTVQCAVH